jgi:hypothetical protein
MMDDDGRVHMVVFMDSSLLWEIGRNDDKKYTLSKRVLLSFEGRIKQEMLRQMFFILC